jgi:hypothetical protein
MHRDSRGAAAMSYLRVARPTDHLEVIVAMYLAGLGFEVLGQFKDHEGFDGVILGNSELGYQLEFTQQAGHPAGRAPTKDNLLVFYHPERDSWASACARMELAGFQGVASWNPYWDARGRTFEDPDGYRVVLQNDRAPGQP